jgi:hypothetical protein
MRETQMKKIIAAAVATAFVAPAFAADVTLSGDVEYTFTSKGAVQSGATGDADFKITATEELPNGMSIMAYVDFDDYDIGDQSSRASKMELSGSFGLVEIGKDSGEAIGEYDEVADVAESGAGYTLNDGHSTANSVVFKPATGIDGLNVAVSYGAGDSSADTQAWSYAVQYTMSGVTLAYGAIDKKDASYNASVMSVSGTFGPVYAAYEQITNPAKAFDGSTDLAEDDSSTAIGVTYNYGPGKLFYETNTVKDDDAATLDTEASAFGVSYKIGALNSYIAFKSEKTNGTEEDDATTVGVEYAF